MLRIDAHSVLASISVTRHARHIGGFSGRIFDSQDNRVSLASPEEAETLLSAETMAYSAGNMGP